MYAGRQQLAYFQTKRQDHICIRLLVWGVFIVETANTAFDMFIIYEPLILQYGKIPSSLPTLFVTQPLCVTVVGFPIQLFFIWRIRTLTQKKLIPGAIMFFSLVAFAGGIWTTIMIHVAATWGPRMTLTYRSAEVWLISSAITDLCIATVLSISLKNKKTGFMTMDIVMDKIIRMTVQSGLVTNFIFNVPLSKLYSNCLLSMLNSREDFKARVHGNSSMSNSSGRGTNLILSGSMWKHELDGMSAGNMSTQMDDRDSGDGICLRTVIEQV
ncbi:hypothetical protein GGX14DRAFT_630077 [Mycena pura]|uniref:DUF6534 domain-containing protein n=1 Tax=Mycena pura TaxID=153505 RepID=A0AAD6YSB5_9AGAR|nr:hypothetical protein GGX14DRAFT_630077 [Mycena pura]